MSKLGKRLISAAKEAHAIARGEADPATYNIYVPSQIDVKAVRKAMRLSREQFAHRSGFTAARSGTGNRGATVRMAPSEHISRSSRRNERP